MPPSPSLGRSSRSVSRSDSHKRGRSLEGVLSFKEKDDDLALFSELQSRERQHFLLESTDDFEDLLSSRAKPFTDLKLGINIPARGENSDLLNLEGDKNDYEWLLTPPETPLFPSLDDEPAAANLVHSGRARSRPISISRSSTMEKSQRSSRGSASPQRLSPSPRSGTSTFQGRPSSAPHSNSGLLRSSSPSRRPSPPPIKHFTPPPRSLTPTSRRSTGGSPSSIGMSGMRGISPARTSRGNSASPKVRAWQSNIPGFSLEAPPNLRTSLADRPASYVRGSSPASRTSRDSSSKFGRQSMSPTPSRSIGSSHSQDRDRLSSHSKGSIASSGDDDADSLQSTPVSVSERPVSRKGISGYPGGRPLAFTKKSMKTFAPSSAPKRSFDSAIRDRRSPQNMFRPLLSSVPSSTFHSGKTSSAHHSLISRNSSVTTSSNASSDLTTSAALDTEGSDQHQDDCATDCIRATFSDIHDEVFEFDKMDTRPEDAAHESHHVSSHPTACDRPIAADQMDVQGVVIIDGHSNILICSICGSRYCPDKLPDSEDNICFECQHTGPTSSSSVHLMDNSEKSQFEAPLSDSQSRDVSEITQNQECTPEAAHHDGQLRQSNMENMDVISEQQVAKEYRAVDDPSHTSNIDDKEGAGISVLLNRSSSVKGPIAHGRTINSSAISFEDLSYARDLTSSLRSSVGHGSLSASSSIDLTSARHGDAFIRRQLSGKLSDSNSNSKPQSTVTSVSGTSVPVYQSIGLSTSSHEGSLEGSLNNVRHIVAGESPTTPSDQVVSLENAESSNNDPSADRAPITEAFVGESHALHETDEDRQKRIGHIENVRALELDETLLAEEGTPSENRIPEEDVEEDPLQCSLSTMSEIEISDSHPSSPGSQIDMVFREDLENSSTLMHHDINGKDASLEFAESGQADIIGEESTVTMEDQEGNMRKSLTLEEATDTILFCNSIIHDLAYRAASIAIEKEKENLEPFERSRPTVTIPDRRDPHGFSSTRTPKPQKARKKRTTETEVKPPLMQNDEKSNEPMVRNVGIPNDGNSMKPPKLESKCNCTIM
ncbi:hypothetical protein KSS87_007457 [Heliosperma pusillum]|nr:hypothetical protein KSS87_007457 [Heliosperma pusillum]